MVRRLEMDVNAKNGTCSAVRRHDGNLWMCCSCVYATFQRAAAAHIGRAHIVMSWHGQFVMCEKGKQFLLVGSLASAILAAVAMVHSMRRRCDNSCEEDAEYASAAMESNGRCVLVFVCRWGGRLAVSLSSAWYFGCGEKVNWVAKREDLGEGIWFILNKWAKLIWSFVNTNLSTCISTWTFMKQNIPLPTSHPPSHNRNKTRITLTFHSPKIRPLTSNSFSNGHNNITTNHMASLPPHEKTITSVSVISPRCWMKRKSFEAKKKRER